MSAIGRLALGRVSGGSSGGQCIRLAELAYIRNTAPWRVMRRATPGASPMRSRRRAGPPAARWLKQDPRPVAGRGDVGSACRRALGSSRSALAEGPNRLVRTGPPWTAFSIAHNALANAFLHAHAGRVEVRLDFQADGTRLSVSDDGVGLPEDYAERGRGFSGMEKEAERVGGRLVVETGGPEGGTTIACVVPHDPRTGGD